MVDVIVTYRSFPGRSERDEVARDGGHVRRGYQKFRHQAITVPASAVERIARRPNVAWVSIDNPVGSAMDKARQVAGHPVHGSPFSQITGTGCQRGGARLWLRGP